MKKSAVIKIVTDRLKDITWREKNLPLSDVLKNRLDAQKEILDCILTEMRDLS